MRTEGTSRRPFPEQIVQVLTEIPCGVESAGTSIPAKKSATSSPAPWR
jgi:hypothetical protein